MVSTRMQVARKMAEFSKGALPLRKAVEMTFFVEKCGFRIVKADETLEYHGIAKPGIDEEG